MAVGCDDGGVYILGKPGVERRFQPTNARKAIILLKFDINRPRLLGLDAGQNVYLWNLETDQISLKLNMMKQSNGSHVSCISLTTFSQYAWVGFEDGHIRAYEIDTWKEAGYHIEPDHKIFDKKLHLIGKKLVSSKPREMEDDEGNTRVVQDITVIDIQTHSMDLSKLLVGYAAGVLMLFNLKRGKSDRIWMLDDKCKLCSFCWSPDGNHIISGYSNGKIALWDVKHSHGPKYIKSAGLNEQIEDAGIVYPLSKIVWLTHGGTIQESTLLTLGGPSEDGRHSLFLYQFSHVDLASVKRSHLFQMDVADFVVLNDSPTQNILGEASTLVVLDVDGRVKTMDIRHGNYPSTWIPSALQLLNSRIQLFKLYLIEDSQLYDLLRRSCLRNQMEVPLALCGGGFSDRTTINDRTIILMVTEDQHVQLWDASRRCLELLWDFSLNSLGEDHVEHDDEIHSAALSFNSMRVAMGLKSGGLLLFQLAKEPADSNSKVSSEVGKPL